MSINYEPPTYKVHKIMKNAFLHNTSSYIKLKPHNIVYMSQVPWISSIEPSNGMKNIYKAFSVYKTIKKNTVHGYYRKLQSNAYFSKNKVYPMGYL